MYLLNKTKPKLHFYRLGRWRIWILSSIKWPKTILSSHPEVFEQWPQKPLKFRLVTWGHCCFILLMIFSILFLSNNQKPKRFSTLVLFGFVNHALTDPSNNIFHLHLLHNIATVFLGTWTCGKPLVLWNIGVVTLFWRVL